MPIIATGGDSKTFTPAPEGTHQAVCVDVLDKGMQPNKFKDGALQHKIDIAWEIDETRDDGKRFVVYKRYTLSLNDKANLRHDLESWRGRAFSFDELAGFDVETVKGANCLVNVQHKKSADGSRTYANVMSIAPLIKGMKKIERKDYVRPVEQAATPEPAPPSDDDAVSVPDFDDADQVPF
jgi:hypothetical protein